MPANQKAFLAALNVYAAAVNGATLTLREAAVKAGFHDWESAHPVVLEWVATTYGVDLVESSSNRNKGALVLDRSNPSFAAADKAYKRVREALTADADAAESPKGQSSSNRFEIPEEIAALAAQLVAACREYDMDDKGLKSLAAQAVAAAFKTK